MALALLSECYILTQFLSVASTCSPLKTFMELLLQLLLHSIKLFTLRNLDLFHLASLFT